MERAFEATSSPVEVSSVRATVAALCANLVGIGLARFGYTPLIPALISANWFTPSAAVYLGAANLAGGLAGALGARAVAARFGIGAALLYAGAGTVTMTALALFLRLPEAVSSLEVFTADPDRVREQRRLIGAALAGRVRIVDWQQANSSLFNAVEIERNVMFLILTLIIVVAAFNIISSMIMMVKDKGRDIAILRTMGASRAMILRIFVLSGASIGIIGTVAGFVLGLVFTDNIEAIRQAIQRIIGTDLFAAEIYFFTRIPARIDTGEVVAVVVMALALSFLATLYPSWRAARLDPVEALRYE